MLCARLGRRQACLGRLASLRPLGWQVDALDQRLEDGGALLAATALADAGPLPPLPPLTSSSGVRLASAWAGASLNDRSSSSSSEETVLVPRNGKRRKPATLRPGLPGELAPLAALCGITDRSALAAKVAALGPKPKQRVLLQHGPHVAAHLQQLGVQRPQLARLLLRCPLLFSWPAEQRAGPLFGQLMLLGLTAAEAARCFEQQPTAAGSRSFEPAIETLAELLTVASRDKGGGAAGSSSGDAALSEAERQLGQLLRGTPAAVALLQLAADTLQQRCTALQQRYSLHPAQLVSALKQSWSILTLADSQLAAKDAALEGELGVDGRRLVGAMLQGPARVVGLSVDTLLQRARALLQTFTPQQLQWLEPGTLAVLLAVDSTVWQRALAVWQVLGVADPAALALTNATVLTYDWLQPDRLTNLLALRRSLGLPSDADAVQRFASYVAGRSCHRLTGRLLFLEQAGQQAGPLPLLVARTPPKGSPPFLTVRDAAILPPAAFAAAVGVSAADLAAFTAALASHPPYQQLREEAAALRERLLRDPEVARLAAAGPAPSEPGASSG